MHSWHAQFIAEIPLVLGAAATVCGALVLYIAWRQSRRRPWLLAIGWGAVAGAYPFWSRAAGFDSGAVMGTTLLMIAALVLVLANADLRTRRRRRGPRRAEPAPVSVLDEAAGPPHRVRTTILRTLAAGPLGYLAAMAAAAALTAPLPWPDADRVAVGACILVVAWALAMIWSCAVRRPGVPIALMTGFTVLCGTTLAVVP